MAAWVPTGMKMGVSIVPWGVVSVPRRAALFLSLQISLNRMALLSQIVEIRNDCVLNTNSRKKATGMEIYD